MSERKFARSLGKPGTAAQLRETVSQVVKETTVQNKPQLVEPLDFESFIIKNKTVLQNDPQREMLMFPQDDISPVVLPRRHRTVTPTTPTPAPNYPLLTRACLHTYSTNWHLVHYKYHAYSMGYTELPHINTDRELTADLCEIDVDADAAQDGRAKGGDGVSREGWLFKGPEIGSERIFMSLAGSKSFKRRYCHLHREIDGTYLLVLYKDERMRDTKLTVVMDFCTDVIANNNHADSSNGSKRGNSASIGGNSKFCFELRMTAGHKSYVLAAESAVDCAEWVRVLGQVLTANRAQEESRAASLERDTCNDNKQPIDQHKNTTHGTLKGLEHSMNPQLIKYGRETDTSIAHARREHRTKLFRCYVAVVNDLKSKTTPGSGPCFTRATNAQKIDPYKEVFGQRVLLRCDRLTFTLQRCLNELSDCQIEPYYTSLCLFDAKLGRKLTENFYFDLNDSAARAMVDACAQNDTTPSHPHPNLPTHLHEYTARPRRAILSVTNAHCDIFVVVRIEKVLQAGTIGACAEPYVRGGAGDAKRALKVQRGIAACCQRLGAYRMPFGWAAKPLFRLYSNDLDTNCDFPAVYRQDSHRLSDDDLLKLLTDYRKPDKFTKLTVIPATLQIKIEPITDQIPNALTTALAPIAPFSNPPGTSPPAFEIAELCGAAPEVDVHPHATFLNHLYVYPNTLHYDAQKTFARARNIACAVELRDSDADGITPLQCIYHRPGYPVTGGALPHPLTRRATCAVLHHTATPIWYDEIKVLLPMHLLPAHHLLFTFRHVSCDVSKRCTAVDSCAGYAWLPLVDRGRLVVGAGAVQLAVAATLPRGYLSVQPFGLGKGNAGPDVAFIDAQRPLFTVTCHLHSTVNTMDQHLVNLFQMADRLVGDDKERAFAASPGRTVIGAVRPTDSEICKILKALHAIHLHTLITFLPTLLDQLWRLLLLSPSSGSGADVGVNVVRVLVNLVHMLCATGRKHLLDSYVRNVFVTPSFVDGKSTLSTVHVEICRHLPNILAPTNTDFLVIDKFMQHAAFFFDIIAKSMAQHLLATGRIKMHRHERFSAEFHGRIEAVVVIIVAYIVGRHAGVGVDMGALNKSLGEFIKKCLSLTDRGFCFRLVHLYLTHTTPSPSHTHILHELRFQLLATVCLHEHYVALCLPVVHTRLSPRNAPSPAAVQRQRSAEFSGEYTLSADWCRHHYLVGVLLTAVRQALNEVTCVRKMGVQLLRAIVAKHEFDNRYESKGQRARIALIYIPWLSVVLENQHRLNTSDVQTTCASNKGSISDQSSVTARLHRFTVHLDDQMVRNSTFLEAIAGQATAIMNGHSAISLSESELSTPVHNNSDNQSCFSKENVIVVRSADADSVGSGSEGTICPSQTNGAQNHTRGVSGSFSNPLVLQQRFDKFTTSETQDILIVFMFVVKYMGDDQLVAYWHKSSEVDVAQFFGVLDICLDCFRYVGKRNIVVQKPNVVENGAKTKAAKAHTLPARINPSDMTNHHENSGTLVIHTRDNSDNLIASENDLQRNKQAISEQNLANEIGLIILDSLGLYCTHFRNVLLQSDGDNAITRKIFDIFLAFLKIGQGETLIKHIFAALRSYINNYSIVLFQGSAHLCGRLCAELLRLCNSRLPSVRQESCALLYLLMRGNFEFTVRRGITRVHLQVIVGVSQMLGSQNAVAGEVHMVGLNSARFQESLSTINSYATSDKAMKGTAFPTEVKDLTKRVRTVLMATLQMREHDHDPEMLVDLQHSLANSYASTPELRHTWLNTMTEHHVRNANYSEAACCQLHIAALIAEYLQLRQLQTWGASSFAAISANIPHDETSLKLDTGVEDIHYTEHVLLTQLETCAEYLDRAERFEVLADLYKLIVPILERQRNYVVLKQAYEDLAKNCDKIIAANKSGRRLLGRYYRVGFYGQAYFEDDSGVEYVYKEPKWTSLSEISERLKRQYGQKFGGDVLRMIQDSAPVLGHDLDAKYAYIQVTHVTPYFEKIDLTTRLTDFEQNHNINCFMFETPFTKDGKARGDPHEQYKRRTILTMACRRSYELTPIEVAIDEMQGRVTELEDVVFALPTDGKKLQLLLQGSVYVQVNAGPLAYANAFLVGGGAVEGAPTEEKVEELKDVFREFLKICYSALQVNRSIISADQTEYHEVLCQNYRKLTSSLCSLFGASPWPHGDVAALAHSATNA